MVTGEYLYSLRHKVKNAQEPDAALGDFSNVDYSETWGVLNSTKKRGCGFRAPLNAHADRRIVSACRSFRKALCDTNVATGLNLLPTSSFFVCKRAASTESKRANTTCTLLCLMDEPEWDSGANEDLGMAVSTFSCCSNSVFTCIQCLVVAADTGASHEKQ